MEITIHNEEQLQQFKKNPEIGDFVEIQFVVEITENRHGKQIGVATISREITDQDEGGNYFTDSLVGLSSNLKANLDTNERDELEQFLIN